MELNGESIYGTKGGPFKPAKWGATTSKGNLIYLHILNIKGKTLKLPPLDGKIVTCHILHGEKVGFSQTKNGISIDLQELKKDVVDNIVVVELRK